MLQGFSSEDGAVALITDKHNPPIVIVCHRKPVRAGRIEPPLKDVSVDDDRTRKGAAPLPLVHRPRVDDKGTCRNFPVKL